MATYATNLAVFDAADSAGNWSELSGHTSGAAPAASTENFWQNSIAVDQATGQATGTTAGMECDYGSTLSWTTSSNWVFLVWQKFDAGTDLYSWASGGMRIGVGSSSGNMNFYNALGDDFGTYPSGGWQNTAIDPEYATADATDGSPSSGSYRLIGSLPNMRAKITKGSPHVCDIIRYGRAYFLVTSTSCTFSGMAAYDNDATRRWGLFYPQAGSYLWKGLMSLGTSGASCTFSDSNKVIRVEDTPRVLSGFNKIEIHNSGSDITWDTISIIGVQTSITGSAPVSPGDFEVVDNATLDFSGCTFTDLGTMVFNGGTNPNDIDGCTFRRCKQITQGGATFTGCLFTNGEDAVTLVADDLDELTGNTFVSDGDNHAVNLGTISADTSVTWSNVLSGYATGTTGDPITEDDTTNAAILVNVGSGFKLTINLATGSTIPSVKNTGTGTVAVVASYAHTLTGLELNTEVTYVTAGTSTVLFHVEQATTSDGNGKYQTTYSHAGGATVDILIHNYLYLPDISNIYGLTLPSADASAKVAMFTDPNYSNP